MTGIWEKDREIVEKQVEIMMLRCKEQLKLGSYEITDISGDKTGDRRVFQVDILGDSGEFIVTTSLMQLNEHLDCLLGAVYEPHKLRIHEQEIRVRKYDNCNGTWYVTIIDADKCCNVSGKSLYYRLKSSGRI